MDEEQKSINEIISELEIEDVKWQDLEWACTEEFLQNYSISKYDIFSYENEYIKIYQELEHYNAFTSNKENIV